MSLPSLVLRAPGPIRFGAELVHREFVLVLSPGRGGTLVCVICPTHHFVTAQRPMKVPCFTSGKAQQLLQSCNFLREWGLIMNPPSRDVPPSLLPWQPHTGGPGGLWVFPHWGWRSEQLWPSPTHAPLCLFYMDNKSRAGIPPTPKGDKPPFLPSQSLLPPRHLSTEKVESYFEF